MTGVFARPVLFGSSPPTGDAKQDRHPGPVGVPAIRNGIEIDPGSIPGPDRGHYPLFVERRLVRLPRAAQYDTRARVPGCRICAALQGPMRESC